MWKRRGAVSRAGPGAARGARPDPRFASRLPALPRRAKGLLQEVGARHGVVEVDKLGDAGYAWRVELAALTGSGTVPQARAPRRRRRRRRCLVLILPESELLASLTSAPGSKHGERQPHRPRRAALAGAWAGRGLAVSVRCVGPTLHESRVGPTLHRGPHHAEGSGRTWEAETRAGPRAGWRWR